MGLQGGPRRPLGLIAFLCAVAYTVATPFDFSECYGGEGDFFQFNVGTLENDVMSFDQFKGKVVIALNVASFCSFTAQYGSLKALKTEFGIGEDPSKCYLEVIGFPSNQHGYQEPSENHELLNTLKYVRPGHGFVPNFPVVGKVMINGQDESPVFTFLKARCPSPFGFIGNKTDITWTPVRNNDIYWNFAKWVIDHNGQPFRRYTPRTEPVLLKNDIIDLLKACEDEKRNPRQEEQRNTTESNSTGYSYPQEKSRLRRTLIRN